MQGGLVLLRQERLALIAPSHHRPDSHRAVFHWVTPAESPGGRLFINIPRLGIERKANMKTTKNGLLAKLEREAVNIRRKIHAAVEL